MKLEAICLVMAGVVTLIVSSGAETVFSSIAIVIGGVFLVVWGFAQFAAAKRKETTDKE